MRASATTRLVATSPIGDFRFFVFSVKYRYRRNLLRHNPGVPVMRKCMSDAHRTIRLPKTASAPSADELAFALAQLRDNSDAAIELSWEFAGTSKWFKLSVEHVEGGSGPVWTLKQSDGLEIKRIWVEQTDNVETVRATASRLSGVPVAAKATSQMPRFSGPPGSSQSVVQSGNGQASQNGRGLQQSGANPATSKPMDGAQTGSYPRFQPGIQCGAQPVFRAPGVARVSGGHQAPLDPNELFEAEEGALERCERYPDELSELEFLGEDGTGTNQLAMQLADPRTGLAGFGAMLKFVDVEVNRFQEYGNPMSLMVFAVCGAEDGPLPINAVTSLVLRVQALKRRLDVAGHLESDLYALVLPNTRAGAAVLLANRLCEALTATPLAPGFDKNTLRLSFGIASVPDQCSDLGTLIAQAKTAMEASK